MIAPNLLTNPFGKDLWERQREAYAHVGVGISEDKAHVREPRVIRMGAEVDGVAGFIGPPREKALETGWLAVWLLGQRRAKVKPMLMLLGRLVRCFEFRRPLMSILDTCWPRNRFAPVLRKTSIAEILRAVGALALAVGSLRTPYSGMVTCSDASMRGAGLCASAGLTEEGKNMLEALDSGALNSFRPSGAMPAKWGCGPRILVVSLFDGIGALMVGLTRLECQVVGYVSCETDKECKRLI